MFIIMEQIECSMLGIEEEMSSFSYNIFFSLWMLMLHNNKRK